jgi:hypothetical protein
MGNVSTKEARSRSNSGRSSSVSQPSNQSTRRHHRSARNQAGTGGDRAKGSDKKSNGGSLVLDPNEMVDGGYLAPHGVYSGPQTYKHKIVRQLMIERRLAPFFKGLADYDEDWSERQLLAAIRGIPLSAVSPDENNNNNNDGGSTGDLTSTSITEENTTGMHEDDDMDTTATSADVLSSSVPNDKGSLSTSPSKQAGSASSSPLPPHAESSSSESDRDPELEKILEMKGEAYHMEYSSSAQEDDETKRRSQSVSSPATSVANVTAVTSITTRQRANTSSRYNQANGAGDGKPVELMVYKGAIECPICFLFYPKYLNHTRCCAQPICSECFVQIKRPDPHPPYHEGGSSEEQSSTSNNNPTTSEREQHELVSEPACCPYCTAPDFGVIYIPPPFRSGLAQESSSSKLHLPSLFSNHGSSGTSTPASDHTTESDGRPRRHRTSVPPSAPEVVTTDQIRPEWSSNLHAARQHQARRSAAANALHATAFLMNNNNNEGGSSSSSSRAKKKKSSRLRSLASPSVVGNGRTQTPVQSASSGESSSRQGLEDMMLVEAIRLSLSEEDSRKKKEKEQKKKAKGKQPEGIPS